MHTLGEKEKEKKNEETEWSNWKNKYFSPSSARLRIVYAGYFPVNDIKSIALSDIVILPNL